MKRSARLRWISLTTTALLSSALWNAACSSDSSQAGGSPSVDGGAPPDATTDAGGNGKVDAATSDGAAGNDAAREGASPDAESQLLTISGTVVGLRGSGLLLKNNGTDSLAVTSSGTFSFATKVASGSAYSVIVDTQPGAPTQTCTVTNGSGSATSNVSNVVVTCSTNSFTIGGNVSGLPSADAGAPDSGSSLVLQNNFADAVVVAASGSFSFPTKVDSGAPYAVTILSQPAGYTCAVSGGTGNVVAGNVSSVAVNCTQNTYTIGGTVSGLAGTGFVIRNNGGNDLNVNANGTFAFSTPLAPGASYAVTVQTQPTGTPQTCTLANATGNVGLSNVTSVAITCTTNKYTIGGTVTNLTGSGLVLRNNGGNDLAITANGSFTFTTPITSGSTYNVTPLFQPQSPSQLCTVTAGSSTVGSANVTNVGVNCATSSYTIGGTVTGLATGGSMVLRNNGGNALTVTQSGSFTFTTPIPSGQNYNVTLASAEQICTLSNTFGTVASSNVTSVTATCTQHTSCAAIHAADATLPSGPYMIDPDGNGGNAPFRAYCDMTTDGGGWLLTYYVDASRFDGWVANNRVANNSPPTGINTQGDIWNVPSTITPAQTLMACTTQDDTTLAYWHYNVGNPYGYFIDTGAPNYQSLTANTFSGVSNATCAASYKAEDGYGFIVLESSGCGSCTNMLFGNYHYASGGQCNSTDNLYGQHTSPYRNQQIGYPLCNKKQTTNGKFWIGVR